MSESPRSSVDVSTPSAGDGRLLESEADEAHYLELLATALAGRYILLRELGKGGMATVYLAHDCRHDRQVALKVLRPNVAAVLGSDRFRQEIKLAAKLSHPNIMPVHDSGEAEGLLYYVMPNVDGLSLRDRLDRESRMPVSEALQIVRAVAHALDYAHRNGVIHRDIKPANIMLHEGHPLVADFGIGKAMSTVGDVGLTLSGVAIGTPAYMSPEQAAGEEDVDGRSDLYSLGCVLFEMLTGEQPFTGPTARVVIAKRFVQMPADVTELCSDIPPAVGQIVKRTMARDVEDRYETASALAAELGAFVDSEAHRSVSRVDQRERTGTPVDSGTNGGPPGAGSVQPSLLHDRPSESASHRRTQRTRGAAAGSDQRVGSQGTLHPDDDVSRDTGKKPVVALVRAATLFGLAGVGFISIVRYLITALGLPDWVFPGAIIWLIAGVPVLLLTGRQEFKRLVTLSGGIGVRNGVGFRRHLTWRRALMGGVVTLVALIALTASYMAMRVVGVGPLGTLMATGEFEEGGRVVISEFADRTNEPGLAAAVNEALRIDLAQSPVVSVVGSGAVRDVLERMGLPPSTTVDRMIATEIAVRDGIPAVVTGEIIAFGGGFVLSARVISAADDRELLAIRESAADASEVIAAVERLSHRLRERIGESLKDIRRSPPLSSVTTTSLPALRRYSSAVQLIGEGRWSQATEFLNDAIALDTTFAEAYVRLGYNLENQGAARSSVVEAMSAAFRHRDRLSESRRNSVAGAYFATVGEPDKSAAAYEASLEAGDRSVLNNLSLQYLVLRQPQKAVDLLREARAANPSAGILTVNLTRALFRVGAVEEANQLWADFVGENPDYQLNSRHTARLAVASDSLSVASAALAESGLSEDTFASAVVNRYGAFLNAAFGRLSDAVQTLGRQRDAAAERGDSVAAFALDVKIAELMVGNGRPADEVRKVLDNSTVRFNIKSAPALDRLLPDRARLRARLGDLAEARRLVREHEIEVLARYPNIDQQDRLLAIAELEHAEGKIIDAIVTFRIADFGRCVICALPGLGRAYEGAGELDSAVVVYERYLKTPFADRIDHVGIDHAFVLNRLGQLHDTTGNRAAALDYYNRFAALRQDADPDLTQAVYEARERIIQLIQ